MGIIASRNLREQYSGPRLLRCIMFNFFMPCSMFSVPSVVKTRATCGMLDGPRATHRANIPRDRVPPGA